MLGANFEDERMWAEAAAANDALEALEDAKRLARRRLAAGVRPASGSSGSTGRVIELKGGTVYVGETLADGRTPHGQGTLLLGDGAQHVGAFAHGRAHGPGTWQDASGRVVVGTWSENRRFHHFDVLDAEGVRWVEFYDEHNGSRVSRECAGSGEPAQRCAVCSAHFHEHVNHVYACRTHRAAYMVAEADEAEGSVLDESAPGAYYRRILSPAELGRRAGGPGGAAKPSRPSRPVRADDGGIWPCCGKRGRSDRGCVLARHVAASRTRRSTAPSVRRR
mmetsp:Transcript_25730/g.66558  ORF Transcript_25730/g.66558 Transcript_25730/m.66558 type:complete len:278 (-) Transcript_25730:194-1027(-)